MPPTNRAARREELTQTGVAEVPSLPLLAIRGYLCFRCLEHHSTLLRCKGCLRASYCSKECQAEDWRVAHKRACKILQEVNRIETMETADSRSWKAYSESTYQKAMFVKANSGRLHKNQIQDVAQVIATQPYCASCHLTGFQLWNRSATLTTCTTCKIVSWCSRCTQSHPVGDCQMYQTMSDLELYRLRRFENGEGVSVISPTAQLLKMDDYRPLSSFGGWQDLFAHIPCSMQGQTREHVDEELHRIMATDSSTMSMTVLAALETTIPDLMNRTELTIHLVGSSGREVTHLLLFEDLLHLLPQLKHLHIILCGPDRALMSPRSSGELGQDFEMGSCPDCTSAGKRKTASIYFGAYHDFKRRPAYSKPDLAVLFHSGRSQEAVESWSPTTRLLISEGTCTVCTTYTEREATEEVEELDQLGAKLLLRPEENKWRGLVPWPEFLEGDEHSAWYHNFYWYIFRGKTS